MYQFKTYEEAYNAASEYFKTKEKRKVYPVDCYAEDNARITDAGLAFHWTDEEVAELKKVMVECHNKYAIMEGEPTITSYEDAEIDEFDENETKFAEFTFDRLDSMIYRFCDRISIIKIHFEDYYCTYGFTFRAYDPKRLKMKEPIKLYVWLTDEEYIYLLAMRLLHGEHFTFMRLVKEKPELAVRFCECVDSIHSFYIGAYETPEPYLIQLNEVDEDAFAIAGPDEEYLSLLFKSKPVFHSVYARTVGRDLLIINSKSLNSLPLGTVPTTLTASADEVMRILDKPTYYLTMLELDNMFGKKDTVYEDIKAFFQGKGIAFTENKESD